MRWTVLAFALFAGACAASASRELGAVSFPVSCASSVQAPFNRGVALLHSFEYDQAKQQFQQIEQQDPGCAMAYWGEAMSFYHQLWDRPSKADLQAGLDLVTKAQAAGARTERERGYLGAAAAFYQSGNVSFNARWTAYSKALDRLRTRFPQDHEATIFYALSLIASPQANDNDLALRKKAVALLEPLFKTQPDHPGVAHYLIHACDNPEMASEGLPAARRYAEIAPSSPHALHMPSHIFTRVGLWQDDVRSNIASETAAREQSATHHRLHAMDFLIYAYLQIGDESKAKSIEATALQVPKADYPAEMAAFFYNVQSRFPVMLALETQSWKEAESLTPLNAGPDFRAITFWAQAIGAGHLHDVKAARAAVANFDAALRAVKKSDYAYVAEGMISHQQEAQAWLAFAEGNSTKAAQLLEAAADRQKEAGKGETEMPAREMLAGMLLESGQADQALAQYERSLKTDPNRFNGLYGAARAAELAQRPDVAMAYYKQLLANCNSESDRPELAKAKAYLNQTN